MSKIKKLVGLGIVVVIVSALLLFFPTIISFVQNPSNSSGASYTSLTLRVGMNDSATLDFGDTEYNFRYPYGNYLGVSTFIEFPNTYTVNAPHSGDVYKYAGIEIDISKVASDYISDYIVILVKPTIQNYMASLHYTELNITLNHNVAVNISSGLTNETHLYDFTYVGTYEITLRIKTAQNTTNVSLAPYIPSRVLNIEIRTFKLESQYIVFYVKPLY